MIYWVLIVVAIVNGVIGAICIFAGLRGQKIMGQEIGENEEMALKILPIMASFTALIPLGALCLAASAFLFYLAFQQSSG